MRAFLMRRLSCQDPKVWMKSVQLNSLNDEGDPQITGKVKFQNNNFFEAKWKDPNIRLYWLPDEGQSITEACSGSSDDADKACEYYDNGRCAIRLGKLVTDDTWKTKARETKTKQMDLYQSNEQELACSRQMNTVSEIGGDQKLVSKGTVKAKMSLYSSTQGWVTEKVQKEYYYYG